MPDRSGGARAANGVPPAGSALHVEHALGGDRDGRSGPDVTEVSGSDQIREELRGRPSVDCEVVRDTRAEKLRSDVSAREREDPRKDEEPVPFPCLETQIPLMEHSAHHHLQEDATTSVSH